jgi:hypothetical protein
VQGAVLREKEAILVWSVERNEVRKNVSGKSVGEVFWEFGGISEAEVLEIRAIRKACNTVHRRHYADRHCQRNQIVERNRTLSKSRHQALGLYRSDGDMLYLGRIQPRRDIPDALPTVPTIVVVANERSYRYWSGVIVTNAAGFQF